MVKTKEFNLNIDFAITLNSKKAVNKSQMKKVTKTYLWDIFKKNKNYDCNFFVIDSNNKHWFFSMSQSGSYSWFDLVVFCTYSDYDINTDNENYEDIEYSNTLYIDYENEQHRKLDFANCEYEFNRT